MGTHMLTHTVYGAYAFTRALRGAFPGPHMGTLMDTKAHTHTLAQGFNNHVWKNLL